MKLGEWTMIIVVMIVFLELMGITTGLGILTNFGISVIDGNVASANMEGTYFWALVLAILATVSAGGAVVIGLFAKSYDTSLVIVPLITGTILIFGSTFFSLMSIPEISEVVWMSNIISIIFIGMGVAFLWSAVDYFAGR